MLLRKKLPRARRLAIGAFPQRASNAVPAQRGHWIERRAGLSVMDRKHDERCGGAGTGACMAAPGLAGRPALNTAQAIESQRAGWVWPGSAKITRSESRASAARTSSPPALGEMPAGVGGLGRGKPGFIAPSKKATLEPRRARGCAAPAVLAALRQRWLRADPPAARECSKCRRDSCSLAVRGGYQSWP